MTSPSNRTAGSRSIGVDRLLPSALVRRPWLRVSAALFAVAWGGNEFTPLLVMYRLDSGMSGQAVNILLGAYVLGIVPALLVGGPLSDRWGRRPVMSPAPLLGITGSTLLACGAHAFPLLFAGRVFSGLALGLVMAVGSSWIKELSAPPYDPAADAGTGARRASLALTAGFCLGAVVTAALAQFGPLRAVLPYMVNVVLTALAAVVLFGSPETLPRRTGPGSLLTDLKVPRALHARFLFVVVPMAPWVFGTAASAYAIVPALVMDQVRGMEVGLSGLLCLVALSCGFGIQAVARRIDTPHSARATVIALALTAAGLGLAALTASLLTVWLTVVTAAVLGLAYGLLMVSGLQEIQRIAGPVGLAGLTAVYYSLSYLGFFVPATLSALNAWFGYPEMFTGGIAIAIACLGIVAACWSRHLPHTGPAAGGSRTVRRSGGRPADALPSSRIAVGEAAGEAMGGDPDGIAEAAPSWVGGDRS